MDKQLEWHNILPNDLRESAFRASNGELAWPKEEALRVINILNANGYMIYGIDSWLLTHPGPTPLVFDWPLPQPISAIEFIKQFDALDPTDKNLKKEKKIIFNIGAKPKHH